MTSTTKKTGPAPGLGAARFDFLLNLGRISLRITDTYPGASPR